MGINYKEIADRTVDYAKKSNIELDFSESSIERVDYILGCYYEHIAEYDGKEGKESLWNIAVHFGIYLGETMLRLQLKDKGYDWYIDDGIPVLMKEANNKISPVTKVHKRILNGPEDSVKSFCDVAFLIANGGMPVKNVLRVIDVQLSSGEVIKNVLYQNIQEYIMLVEKGKEEFVVLNSSDGFLQFYGVDNQFVAEMRINLKDGDFRTYSVIDRNKEMLAERVLLDTPYGQFTPAEREVLSLEMIKTVVRRYYENINEEDFLKEISYIETTDETKRCMGLI